MTATDTGIPERRETRPPGLGELFAVTFRIGILSFGGGLSGWMHRVFVVQRGWISDEDFAASLAVSQILPGANVVNLLVCLGEQWRGAAGAVTCLAGFLIGPFFAVIALCMLFDHLTDLSLMQAISAGVAFAALGLLVTTAWSGIRRSAARPWTLGIVAATAIAVGILKLSLILTVLVLGPVSIALAWRTRA